MLNKNMKIKHDTFKKIFIFPTEARRERATCISLFLWECYSVCGWPGGHRSSEVAAFYYTFKEVFSRRHHCFHVIRDKSSFDCWLKGALFLAFLFLIGSGIPVCRLILSQSMRPTHFPPQPSDSITWWPERPKIQASAYLGQGWEAVL